jgi:phage tail tape-measure protein
MIEQAIYTILAGNAAVGAIAGDRISPHQRVQGTALPALVYVVDDFEPIRGLAGTAGLTAATVTVTSIADTYSSARSLAASVIGALNGAAGTYGSVVITSLHYSQQQPTDTGIGEGEEDLPYEVETQYRIHFTGL